jgi:hypothetical protein
MGLVAGAATRTTLPEQGHGGVRAVATGHDGHWQGARGAAMGLCINTAGGRLAATHIYSAMLLHFVTF